MSPSPSDSAKPERRAASDTRVATLTVHSGFAKGRKFLLRGDELTLGRADGCEVWIPDPGVSRRHARLTAESSACWWVEDLNSANGTRVNGRTPAKQLLIDGDWIELAEEVELIFRIEQFSSVAALTITPADVGRYTASGATTVDTAGFIAWLKSTRDDLGEVEHGELERIATECMLEYAHSEMARASETSVFRTRQLPAAKELLEDQPESGA